MTGIVLFAAPHLSSSAERTHQQQQQQQEMERGYQERQEEQRIESIRPTANAEKRCLGDDAACKALSPDRDLNCSADFGMPQIVVFKQVESFVGPVEIGLLKSYLSKLIRADRFLPEINATLVFFALDGTLLNLLRWGRIVNDNDIDLGFFLVHRNGSLFCNSSGAVMSNYKVLQSWLYREGIMALPITERDVKKIHDSKKPLKPSKCKHRGQMMQCRPDTSNVIIDFFGPETLFSNLTRLQPFEDVLPLRACKSFSFSFPCPSNHLKVLQQFTLDFSTTSPKSSNVVVPTTPTVWYEFRECALFPRKKTEQSARHVTSIIDTGKRLEQCGFPTMLSLIDHRDCQAVMSLAS